MLHLEYLGLFRVGEGNSLTDSNLERFAIQLKDERCPALRSLNLSFSDTITDRGVEIFKKIYPIEIHRV
jgi:hypothetical protein